MTIVLSRATKQAARYTPLGGSEHCSRCRFYMPQGTCGRIIGPVSPEGWCRFYSMEAVQRSNPGYAGFGGSPPPTADLNFMLTPGTLPPGVVFTRASVGTYFDVAGTIQTATTNTPRWNYDPVTHALRGLLMETSRANSVTNSNLLTSHTLSGSTRTNNATAAPDGATTATRVTEDTSASVHNIQFSFTTAASTTYTASYFVKAGARTKCSIELRNTGNWADGALFIVADLAAGTINAAPGAAITRIQNVGNGWFRVSLTATTSAGATGVSPFIMGLANAAFQVSYTGDGASGAFFWGAQLEVGAFPSSYISSGASATTRAADHCTLTDAVLFGGTTDRTVAVEAYARQMPAPGTNQQFAVLDDGGTNNVLLLLSPAASANVRPSVTVAGVAQIAVPTADMPGAARPAAFKAALANGAVYNTALNGVLGPTSGGTSARLGPLTTLRMGEGQNTLAQIDGEIQRARYWPRALSQAELLQVTT